MVKGSIIAPAPKRRDLALGGVVPHVVQRRADAPGVREQDLLHRLDGDGLDLAGARERRAWPGHGDVDVQIRDGGRDEPRQVGLDPLRGALEPELFGVPGTQDSMLFLVSIFAPVMDSAGR